MPITFFTDNLFYCHNIRNTWNGTLLVVFYSKCLRTYFLVMLLFLLDSLIHRVLSERFRRQVGCFHLTIFWVKSVLTTKRFKFFAVCSVQSIVPSYTLVDKVIFKTPLFFSLLFHYWNGDSYATLDLFTLKTNESSRLKTSKKPITIQT